MARDLSGISRMFILQEAIASVSMSHPEECGCRTCRAAAGDTDAFVEIYMAVRDGQEGQSGDEDADRGRAGA